MIHEWSAFGGADRCDATHYAATDGSGSKIFLPGREGHVGGQHSAGALKNGNQAIARSWGGLSTKIHALVDALGNPVELMLSPGQANDLTCAEPLLENSDPAALIGDKAYDADAFIQALTVAVLTAIPNCSAVSLQDNPPVTTAATTRFRRSSE